MPRSKPIPRKWISLFKLIPGYDPVATTAPGDWFDVSAAEMVCEFFPACLRHIEGELAGQPFKIEPWQQAMTGCLFGWKRADGTRRYREAFVYVPRKNGKSPWAAGIANYVLFCDDEQGQQNLCAAGDREQAALVYRHCKGMIEQEPELDRRAKIYGGAGHRSVTKPEDGSSFRVISSEADTKHGGNLHLAIIDELHVQKSRDLVDVIQTSMASANRRQPLLIHITTADFARASICNEKLDYASKVRDGVIQDHSFLPVIYAATIEDDWTSPKIWKQANPNIDVSVSREYLERECQRAQDVPGYENTFKRLHLNIQTEQDVRWLALDQWDRGIGDVAWTDIPGHMIGRECFGALDLSSKQDLTAWVLVFPPHIEGSPWVILPRFYAPRDSARERERRDRVPYIQWAREDAITLTEGNVVDYEHIKDQVKRDHKKFSIKQVAYDPWNATQIALQLADAGATMIEFGQGYRSMSEPAKETAKLLAEGKMAHGGHPVLRWNAANVAIEEDPAGNIKPSKKKSTERIDGIVATVMGVGLAILAETKPKSIYETRGVLQV